MSMWMQGIAQDPRFGVRRHLMELWFTAAGPRAVPGHRLHEHCFHHRQRRAPERRSGLGAGSPYRALDARRAQSTARHGSTRLRGLACCAGQYFGPFAASNLFSLIGQRPILGDFSPEDDRPSAPVVILSHGWWMSRYGGDPAVIGRTITVNGLQPTIIGVMAPGMKFPPNSELWMPVGQTSIGLVEGRRVRSFQLIGRLADGVTLGQARDEISAIAGTTFGSFAAIALVLSGVGLYALTAYGVSQRRQEIGVRVALGARPSQIIWMILHRVLAQAVVGVAIGLVGAFAVERTLQGVLVQTGATDPITLTAALVLLIVVVLNAWPAFRAARLSPLTSLRYD
jgi:hypothetical protein